MVECLERLQLTVRSTETERGSSGCSEFPINEGAPDQYLGGVQRDTAQKDRKNMKFGIRRLGSLILVHVLEWQCDLEQGKCLNLSEAQFPLTENRINNCSLILLLQRLT